MLTYEYDYDANGNRVAYTGPEGTVSATYDARDRLLTYGTNSYTYNHHGQLTSKTSAIGTTSYNYDELGNLLSVTLPDSTLIEYIIDALGRRVGKKVNGALVRQWTYQDRLNPVAEYDGSGTLIQQFVYATRMNVPDLIIRGGTTYRVIADQVGSVRRIVEITTGAVAQEVTYSPFGKVLSDSSPGWQPFAYAGGLYDNQTKLVRFGARDYDAEVGRWTAKDPIGFDGGQENLMIYAANDPINLIDANGLLFGGAVDAGEGVGENSAMYWADVYNNSTGIKAFGAALMGSLASLWTPCTSDKTFTVLTSATGPAALARRPFWRYVGPKSNPASGWLTRGWKPPYGTNFAKAKDALQLPHMPTNVVKVKVPWYRYVRGPRKVSGNPQWGRGGGTEYFQGGPFP